MNKNQILSLKIENAYSPEDLESVFKDCDSITDALNSIKDYFELINKYLEEKRQNIFFIKKWLNFTVDIKLPEANEKDDIDKIYESLKKIIEKERNSEKNIINYNNLIKNLNIINEKNNNLDNLIKLKKIINLLEKEKKEHLIKV